MRSGGRVVRGPGSSVAEAAKEGGVSEPEVSRTNWSTGEKDLILDRRRTWKEAIAKSSADRAGPLF
jgi:hypothetical protein